MRSKYKVIEIENGEFSWLLVGGNHRVLLRGRRFATPQAAAAAIDRCRKCAAAASRLLRERAETGEPCFRLIDDSGSTIARSELYLSETARDRGMEAARHNATTPIEIPLAPE